ncbi:MAG: hypothetical protein AB7O78_01635 [Thermoleophilia bacterium]
MSARRNILLLVVGVSFALHGLWGYAWTTDLIDRQDRRADINALACAIQKDARNSANVVIARRAAGDPRTGDLKLLASKRDLILTAGDVADDCPDEKGP